MKIELLKIVSRFSFLDRSLSVLLNSFFFIIRKFITTFSRSSERVVIIALHLLGDTVFTIPAIRIIQNKIKAPITIVCYEESKKIYSLVLEDVNYQIFNKNDFLFNQRIAKYSTIKKFNLLKPKLVFDLTGVMTSASLLLNSSAIEIIGFNRHFFKSIYTHYFNAYEGAYLSNINQLHHSIEIYLNAISPYIQIDKDKIEKEYTPKISNDNVMCFAPFAGWNQKEWGMKNFLSLANRFTQNRNIKFVVPAGSIKKDVMQIIDKNITVMQTKSIDELIKEISASSIVIGNDSGPIQIASVIGIPTFSIYGPTNPTYHIPYAEHHHYIKKMLSCSPKQNERLCFTNGGRNGCPSNECLKTLDVDTVFAELDAFITKLSEMINSSAEGRF